MWAATPAASPESAAVELFPEEYVAPTRMRMGVLPLSLLTVISKREHLSLLLGCLHIFPATIPCNCVHLSERQCELQPDSLVLTLQCESV
jgi:hypothetical protein